MKIKGLKFLLFDPANPERVSGANATAMAGRVSYILLFLGGRLGWNWLEELVSDPEGLALLVFLVSEGVYFLRRALARIESDKNSGTN